MSFVVSLGKHIFTSRKDVKKSHGQLFITEYMLQYYDAIQQQYDVAV